MVNTASSSTLLLILLVWNNSCINPSRSFQIIPPGRGSVLLPATTVAAASTTVKRGDGNGRNDKALLTKCSLSSFPIIPSRGGCCTSQDTTVADDNNGDCDENRRTTRAPPLLTKAIACKTRFQKRIVKFHNGAASFLIYLISLRIVLHIFFSFPPWNNPQHCASSLTFPTKPVVTTSIKVAAEHERNMKRSNDKIVQVPSIPTLLG